MKKEKKCSNCKHNNIHRINGIPFARECLVKGYPHPRNRRGQCTKYEAI